MAHAGHQHSHDHATQGGHGHHHHAPPAPGSHNRAFLVGIVLNTIYVVLEGVFGVIAGSMALLADAGHNLSDVLSLLLAWGAAWLATRRPTRQHTYGYKRTTILASLTNAIILLIAVGAIAWEAMHRLVFPQPVESGVILWVAAVGILVNAGTAAMFMAGRKGDINIRGAFLHMAADAGVTVGVVVAAIVIGITGWTWLDPAVSLAIAGVIVVGTWGLLRDSVNLALDAVPEGVDRDAVEAHLRGLPGVVALHDLHIWGMSTTETALTAHLVRPRAAVDDDFLRHVAAELKDRFGIGHATLQLETGEGDERCQLAPQHVV